MSIRQNALNEWLGNVLNHSPYTINAIPGDASFRHYFRVMCLGKNYIVMDAPPTHIKLQPFLNVANLLKSHHVHVPEIFAFENELGFALLEDLGDTLLYSQAYQQEAEKYYLLALDTIIAMQQCATDNPHLPLFDDAFMLQEMQLFQTWFLEGWLGMQVSASEQVCIGRSMQQLADQLASQPQLFMHRDYHSRNLLIIKSDSDLSMGVIDFQDAMRGPWTYDLVSLTKDCYINWPKERQDDWVSYFYQQLPNQFGWSLAEFQQAVDWCGLQRHLKVLGVFCRLHLRDKKSSYLHDLPLTLQHVLRVLARYEEFNSLYEFMQERVLNPFKEKQSA